MKKIVAFSIIEKLAPIAIATSAMGGLIYFLQYIHASFFLMVPAALVCYIMGLYVAREPLLNELI